MGMRFVLTRKLPNGRWWDLIWEMIMPLNVHRVYTEEPKTEQVRAVTYCVPVDDTHQLGASIRWVPAGQGEALTGASNSLPRAATTRATNTYSAIRTTKRRWRGKDRSRFMV